MSDASIEIPLEQFDMSLLPQGARQPGTEAFRDAVTAFFQTELRAAAEWVQVGVDQQSIRVAWRGKAKADPLEQPCSKREAICMDGCPWTRQPAIRISERPGFRIDANRCELLHVPLTQLHWRSMPEG
jgi:hypothetical protein